MRSVSADARPGLGSLGFLGFAWVPLSAILLKMQGLVGSFRRARLLGSGRPAPPVIVHIGSPGSAASTRVG